LLLCADGDDVCKFLCDAAAGEEEEDGSSQSPKEAERRQSFKRTILEHVHEHERREWAGSALGLLLRAEGDEVCRFLCDAAAGEEETGASLQSPAESKRRQSFKKTILEHVHEHERREWSGSALGLLLEADGDDACKFLCDAAASEEEEEGSLKSPTESKRRQSFKKTILEHVYEHERREWVGSALALLLPTVVQHSRPTPLN